MTDQDRIRLAYEQHPGEWVCFDGDAVVWRGMGSKVAMEQFRDAYERDPTNKHRPLHIVHPSFFPNPRPAPHPAPPRPDGDPPPRPAGSAALTIPMSCACVSSAVCVHRRASQTK